MLAEQFLVSNLDLERRRLGSKLSRDWERMIGCPTMSPEPYNKVIRPTAAAMSGRWAESEEDWARGWHQLKHSGVWDVEYFGDLMIIALAHYIRKNILLINTDPASAPVTVVLGDRFGRPLDSEHPVILAYSGTHYEGLLPVTDRDEAMARRIIQKYIKEEDLFSGSEEQSPDLIQSRRIFIEKCEPTIDSWDSSQQPQVAASSPPSPSCDVEAGDHRDQGLESWRRHHPANTGTFPTQWASSGNLDTISIPIKIVTSQH